MAYIMSIVFVFHVDSLHMSNVEFKKQPPVALSNLRVKGHHRFGWEKLVVELFIVELLTHSPRMAPGYEGEQKQCK